MCACEVPTEARSVDSLELESQVVMGYLMWVLETEEGFSTRTVNAFNHGAISLAPEPNHF